MRPLVRMDFLKIDDEPFAPDVAYGDLEGLTQLFDDVQNHNNVMNRTVADMAKRLDALKSGYESLVAANTTLQAQCRQLKSRCNELEEENIRLLYESEETKRKNAEQTIQINKCIYTLAERDSQIYALENRIEEMASPGLVLSAPLPPDAVENSVRKACSKQKKRATARLCRGELPDELMTDRALKIWSSLIDEGFVTPGYALTKKTTRQLAAYIAQQFDYKLHLSCKWASFERLWGVRNLCQEAARQCSNGPVGHDLIDCIFDMAG